MEPKPLDLLRLRSEKPLVVQAGSVLPASDLQDVTRKLKDRHWLAQRGVPVRMDQTGTSFELRDNVIPVLTEFRERLRNTLGIEHAQAQSIRVRRYFPGDAHKVHTDHYAINDQFLLATAILYLNDVQAGGATNFVDVPNLSIPPESNSLVAWVNYLDDLSEDMLTRHESTPVEAGEKLIAIYLFYGDKNEVVKIRQTLSSLSR